MPMENSRAGLCLAIVLTMCVFNQPVMAADTTWNEATDGGGDAGQSLGSAQHPTGSGLLTRIRGTIGSQNDVDIYKIHIPDLTKFAATTLLGAAFDTQLFLFDENGNGIVSNDDFLVFDQSLITGFGVGGPACYYLAISSYDQDPRDASNNQIFPDAFPLSELQQGPNPGAGPLSHWDNAGNPNAGTGQYSIWLFGAEYCDEPGAVPEPATLSLLGVGLMLGMLRRRKQLTA